MVGLRIAYFYPISKQENTPDVAVPICAVDVAARAPAVDVAGVMCGPGAKGFKAYLPRRLTIR